MSQTGSSSGVRVATQPLSNVYTVLLLVGAVALVLALVLLCIVMNRNYGAVLGEANTELLEKVAAQQEERRIELEKVDQALTRFPEGISASAPAATSEEEGAGTGEAGEMFPDVESE